MTKRSNSLDGNLIVIAIIAAPFVLLYQWLGPVWFWTIIIGTPASWLAYKTYKCRKPATPPPAAFTQAVARAYSPAPSPRQPQDNADIVLSEIQKRIHAGDWDTARRMLRSIAWETHRHSSQEFKDAFKEAMCSFAMKDPLFNLMLPALAHHVMENPGCIQSGIYRHFPAFDVEDQRYVLYYGEAIGHIARVKNGNSYALYLPGHPDIPSRVVDDRLTSDEQEFLQEMRAKAYVRLPCSDYWQGRLGEPDRLLKRLASQGHFRAATLHETLTHGVNKPEIAAALRKNGAPLGGTKDQLITRLCALHPDEAESLVADISIYLPAR